MKKFLPTSTSLSVNKPSGFTLIELMVVVAIIAILAVIGFAIFQNAQKNARDGIRRGEINNLAKSIESSRDPTTATGNYLYADANYKADYPTNKPSDPRKDDAKAHYCVSTGGGSSSPFVDGSGLQIKPGSWVDTSQCSAGVLNATVYAKIVDKAGAYQTSGNALVAGARYWQICALLEVPASPNNIFCINNSQ